MNKVNFIGAYDKTDCILYVAKILQTLGKRILIIDSTVNQKARYIVPAISPTVSYVTEFEEMDIAVGFKSFSALKGYLGIPEESELDYDYILIDIDDGQSIEKFQVDSTDDNYFVTAFDMYSLKRGLEALNNLRAPLRLTKILFSRGMVKEEDDYLNFLSANLKIIWEEYKVYFPFENGDATILAENERLAKIKFKTLSPQYKESLLYIAEGILKDVSGSQLRKAMKTIEKDKGV